MPILYLFLTKSQYKNKYLRYNTIINKNLYLAIQIGILTYLLEFTTPILDV